MSKYNSYEELAKSVGRNVPAVDRPVVCIQGLGFVGTAMAIAVAKARDPRGEPYINVIGVDLPTQEGTTKINSINTGMLTFKCNDTTLLAALKEAHSTGNLIATSDPEVYSMASIIVVDVHLDVSFSGDKPKLELDGFRKAIRTLGEYIREGCLIIIETTVPPGTCKKIVAPELIAAMKERNMPEDSFLLAHSYERVMPGKNYLDSIINIWRIYSGHTPEAADVCEQFLSKIINIDDFPLTRIHSTTGSEIGKVLENSYRATTIAFMEEWGRFAEAVGVDLFEVINAIRMRPTHNNMRTPGFGVGGYCITKDPLIAHLSATELFGFDNMNFPFSTSAVATNNNMPLVSLDKVQKMLNSSLKDKTILLLGVSYIQDVGDTRYSPSQIFVEHARSHGARVICHDPFIDYWQELDETLPTELPSPEEIDAVVFAVPHEQYKNIEVTDWLRGSRPAILDAFNVLSKKKRKEFKKAGCKVMSIGRGEEL